MVCVGLTINNTLNAQFNKNQLLQNWKTNPHLSNWFDAHMAGVNGRAALDTITHPSQ